MATPATRDDFLQLLRKTSLLTPQQLDSLIQQRSLPADASGTAAALIQAGVLTRFQADQLLKGRYRGFELGKYRILEPIGGGAMGTVLLCEHQQMRHKVAVKLLSRQIVEKDPTALARFQREARAAAALNHPNIVRTHDIDQANGHHYLVMDYVEGETLQEVVAQNGCLPAEQAIHYVIQAALGLQHIHEAGLIHRDLKPGNLLLDSEGTVKILDLGLALFTEDDDDQLTNNGSGGTILGTADFLSPEQAANSHDVDNRTDIFSLGATLYYLLTGRPPYGDLPLTRKLLALHLSDPRPIREFRKDLPPGLVAIIEKMMAKDPSERFQSALEVAHALAPFLGEPIELPSLEEAQRKAQAAADGVRVVRKGKKVPGPGSSLLPGVKKFGSSIPGLRPQSDLSLSSIKFQSFPGSSGGVRTTGSSSMRLPRQTVSWMDRFQHHLDWLREHPKLTAGGAAAAGLLLMLSIFVLPSSRSTQVVAHIASFDPRIDPNASVTHRVTQSGQPGTFKTIREALGKAKPGDRIQLVDPIHYEQLEVEGSFGRGVTVQAGGSNQYPVIWRRPAEGPREQPLVKITNVSGFQLEGPVILDGDDEVPEVVTLEGNCPGVVLKSISFQRFAQHAIALRHCQGASHQPIVLEDLQLIASPKIDAPVGIGILGNQGNVETRHVFVQESRFIGHLVGAIQVTADAVDIQIRNNRFFRNREAVRFDRELSKLLVELANNTFYEAEHAIFYQPAFKAAEGSKFIVRRNLFVRTKAIANKSGEAADLTLPKSASHPIRAKWIWSDEGRDIVKEGAPAGTRYFRKAFYLPTTTAKEAWLEIAGDDVFTAWLNGQLVAQGQIADKKMVKANVNQLIRPGKNVLAVKVTNQAQAAGLIAQLTSRSDDGTATIVAATDDTWRGHAEATENWHEPDADDSIWSDARIVAEFGRFHEDLNWEGVSKPVASSTSVLLPESEANFRDSVSMAGRLHLETINVSVPALAIDPIEDKTFLRYSNNDALARMGPGGSPVGAPPFGVRSAVAAPQIQVQLDAPPGATQLDLAAFRFRSDPESLKNLMYDGNQGRLAFYSPGTGEITTSFPETGDYEIYVQAAGNLLFNEFPKFKLFLDHVSVSPETELFAEKPQWYQFNVRVTAGNHVLGIEYTNDLYRDSQNDRNLFVHGVAIRRAGAASPPNNRPISKQVYRLESSDLQAAFLRVQSFSVLEQSGNLPRQWLPGTWDPQSVALFGVEPVEGTPALFIRNLGGRPSSMLFLDQLPLQPGRRYLLRFRYRTSAGGQGFIKFKDGQTDAYQLGGLAVSDDRWQHAERIVQPSQPAPSRFEFFNTSPSQEQTLYIKDVEVIEQ